MHTLKKVADFILKSSADPSKTSATIKFALLGIIPYIMQSTDMVCRLGYECVSLDTSLLEAIFIGIAEAIFLILSLISIVGMIYGATRKFYLTVIGENKAIR